jgi:hypothetical protein
VSVATATPPIVVVFVAPAIEAPSSEESGPQNITGYYDPHYDGFPSSSNDELGYWAGIATHVSSNPS